MASVCHQFRALQSNPLIPHSCSSTMEIEALAHKLEPLAPKHVARWRKARESVDPVTRSLLDRQLINIAHRKLGNIDTRMLISLPPERRIRGAINLGTIQYAGAKWPAGISTGELLQNLAVVGRSGAGKTNVAFHLLRQLTDRKIPFLFLDWKRTARHLLPRLKAKVNIYTPGRPLSPLAFNPFVPPPGLEPSVHINHVIDAMADAYTLGDGSRSVLQRAISKCFEEGLRAPTPQDILSQLENFPDRGRAGSWKISAQRALESMSFSQLSATKGSTQEELATLLLRGNTIVELDSLSQADKKFLVPMICLWLYHLQLSDPVREKLRLVIFVEEAHHVLRRSDNKSKESLMETLLRQCREVGIAMIVIDQMPHALSSAVLGNVHTTITLNLTNPTDINKAAGISQVEDDDKGCFSSLPVGQAVVKLQSRWTRPFVVQFPLVQVRKGSVTDTQLSRYVRRNRARTPLTGRQWGEFGRITRGPMWDSPLSYDALRLLEDVKDYEDDGVKRRYDRLGMSAGAGTRLKKELLDAGWLDAQVVELGRTRKLLLRLSSEARKALGIDTPSTNASIAHEYWKRCYARKFEADGYQVELEAPAGDGRIDVLARRNGESVGIEVETGKSDAVSNVKRALTAKIDRVIVVATDEIAYKKVEQELAEAGLLINGRVEIGVGEFLASQLREISST